MNGWHTLPFSEAPITILDGDRGAEYPKQSDYHPVGDWLFLNTSNVRPDGFDFTECQFILDEKEKKLRKGRLSRGDIVMTTRGTIGNVGFYDDRVQYEKMRINSGMVVLRADANQILPSFLYQVVRSNHFRAQVRALTSGAAQPQLPIRDINLIKLPIPPISQQRRIASILGAYDDLIGVNRRRIALLEEMSRRLFEEWFIHFRFPGHEDRALVRHGSLPKGWRSEELGAVCSEIRDAVLPASIESNTPYVGLEHIPRRSTTLDAWGRADEVTSTKLRFQVGDVLFGKIRPYFHKVVLAPFDGVSSSDAIVIRSRSPEFIGLVLSITSSDSFVAHSVATSNGTKMPRANWSVLARTPISVPPDALMATFNKAVISWAELAAALNGANVRLAASRDVLLPRLISDELSVSDAARELEAVA
jgi:type I restriction enzyme S subunit